MFNNSTNIVISPKHEHRLLGLLLISLHFILWWDFYPFPWSEGLLRVMLLIHCVLFALWQPLWGEEFEPPTWGQKIFLTLFVLLIIIWPVVSVITIWQLFLLALLAGRDLAKPLDRIINSAAILFLTLQGLWSTLPQLFQLTEILLLYQWVPFTQFIIQAILLLIPLIFLLFATESSREFRYYINFFHGLTFVMLMLIIGLGSLAMISHLHFILPLAIAAMTGMMILFILIFSGLWMIFANEANMDQMWTRPLLSIGNTLEQWLELIAQPDNYKNLTPQEFLQAGFEQLVTLPWISGIAWHSLYGEETVGYQDKKQVILTIHSLEVSIYASHRISSSQYFQIRILVQLLEYFHQAKRREAAFAQQAQMQAIHEAGAKLTHDIKNLLQSLHAITSVIETYPPNQFGDTQRLLQGQMPHLTQRLKRTLDKLQKPAEFSYSHVPISLWWDNLKARYRKSKIKFVCHHEKEAVLIPEDLFDNVAENLLQNALHKRQREPLLQIKMKLYIHKQKINFTVCDDGSAIAPEIYPHLLTQPVTSQEGFGIGLYQAVKQLAHTGYELKIIDNTSGHVCFELATVS